jgi:cytochrome c oxidase subunit II
MILGGAETTGSGAPFSGGASAAETGTMTMRLTSIPLTLMAFLASHAAFAQDTAAGVERVGKPLGQGTGFQPAASELAVNQQWLDDMLLYLCIAVSGFVVILLAIVILRYNARSNPVPAKFTHNSPLEVAWTLIPVVILVVLGAFSLPILFQQQEIPEGDITIKVTGNQWYWTYEYPDEGVAFDSYMLGHPATLGDEDAGAIPYVMNEAMAARLERSGYTADEFLLATDTQVVIPVGKTIVMNVTGTDVIHSWTIPAFAVKQDAVPGRIAHLWFKADREGLYFGQCSELCGKDHAYMPITVRVVSEADYAAWLAATKTAQAWQPVPVKVASAD